MTALNYILAGDRGIVIQDGAAYERDGTISHFTTKTKLWPGINGVIANAGPTFIAPHVEEYLLPALEDIDHMAEFGRGMADAICDVSKAHMATDPRWGKLSFTILLVGWSQAQKRIRSVIFGESLSRFFDVDIPRYVDPLPDGVAGDLMLKSYFSSIIADGGPENFDAGKHGLPLIEAQRRQVVSTDHDMPARHIVGGNVQVTEVSRTGVIQRIIHRWPDEVGKKIDPNASRLSRQQRRAMARNNR